MRNMVASCFCFRKPRMTAYLRYTFNNSVKDQLISFHDMLMRLLIQPEIKIIVINGIGGSGKTWAAKAAFKHAGNVCPFDNCIWVSLSKKCGLGRCIEKIAACLSIAIGEGLSIERTRVKIKEQLIGRKFLLILDNAYFTEENILEHLGIPHPRQQNLGSKVIVTTRTRRMELVMAADIVITPVPLTNEESHDLLCEQIGKGIDSSRTLDLVRNCYGMPLSVILLAGALCDLPKQQTQDEVISHISASLGTKVSVFHAMHRLVKFGYSQLPNNTTRACLLYCLLFPEDQGIPVKYLILCWIMDGLVPEASEFHKSNRVGHEILTILLNHGMVYLEDNDHVRMHDVVRETISIFGQDHGYVEHADGYFDYNIRSDLHRLGNRLSLMNNTRRRELFGSIELFWISTLLLRGNHCLNAISEEFFQYMQILRVLDLSFTRIKALPSSISCLTRLRMLLMIECLHLEKVQHIDSLSMLEVLDASGCGSLKFIEPGSFDHMTLLKILDFSRTPISCLPSLAACMALHEILLQDCPFLKSQQTSKPNISLSETEPIKFPFRMSKTGLLTNVQLGSTGDLIDWMVTGWLPGGLTFELSDRLGGMRVSWDPSKDSKTYIYASNTSFVHSLDKDSPLWLNCFLKFHIVICPSKVDNIMCTDAPLTRTQLMLQGSYSKRKHFANCIGTERILELDGASMSGSIDGIISHAKLISLKRVTAADYQSKLNITSMKAAQELWIENCDQLQDLFSVEEVQALSAIGKLQNLWISSMENLTSFCKGVKYVTNFSCLVHLLIDSCPKLTLNFPSPFCLSNLQTLHIRFCDSLEKVFDVLTLGEDALPGLQSLQLWELPELACVCGGVLPSLKDLKVRGCAKLRKIPVGVNENSPFFTTIIGETPWWNSLIWDDESIKRWMLCRSWGPLVPHLATEG